jgi:hypothetical protein
MSTCVFLVALAVIVYAMARGQDVESVDAKSGKITFYSAGRGSLDRTQIEQRQSTIEKRTSDLETRARSAGSEQPGSATNLSGTWRGANGLQYQIQQYGSQAVIEEISPYGVTAVGSGEVSGQQVQFAYQAIDGSTGIAQLTMADEGTLRGTFMNYSCACTVPAVLRR